MAQVQPVIQQALHSADDAEMIPAVDDRVSQLETQIKQINENMMKTTQSFQVFQQQQMQQNQTMTHQISSVKQQVDSQHQSLQAMLDHKMEDQMSRIEALLVKRMKVNEWPMAMKVEVIHLSSHHVWSILLQSITMRIGEAKNPGPPGDPGLTIGAINACGLGNKSESLKDLPFHGQSIWGVSETHLTATGIVKFRQDLQIKKSVFAIHHGAPAPYRSTTQHSIGGKHVGAGFLSTVPCKNLAKPLPDEIVRESRVDIKTLYCQGKWLQGATCYGYAHRAETQEVRHNTDKLLQCITDTIVNGAKGYRFITGDFNQPHGILDQTKIWEQHGWREVQAYLQEKENRPIQATCKNLTTRDFVWLSPELLQHLEGVEVVEHIFPDHAIVCAHLRSFFGPDPVYLWRKPKTFDWTTIPALPDEAFQLDTTRSTSEQMLCIAKEFENRVVKVKQQQKSIGCHQSQLGRSATTDVVKIMEYSKPVPKAREGDYQPNYSGISLTYSRWVKQMRRLESLCRNLAKGTNTENAKLHASKEWRGVMTATGFPQGFQYWWNQLENKHGQAPNHITWMCPNFVALQGIVFTFMTELHHFEEILNQELQQKAKDYRVSNPNKIFDDIAKPRASPIQLLEETVSSKVVEVTQQTLTIDTPDVFDPNQDIQHNGQTIQSLCQVGPKELKTLGDTQFVVGDELTQERKFGSVTESFSNSEKNGWSGGTDMPIHQKRNGNQS